MKALVTILIFAIVIIIGWNIFPMVLGLIRVLLGLGFVLIFILGVILGRWMYKKSE